MEIRSLATRVVGLLTLLFLPTGCIYGALYSSTTEPLDENVGNTPRAEMCGNVGTRELSLPITSANVSVAWNSCAIADAAREAQIERIDYADLHTLSIFFGVWRQRTVQVYGRKADGSSAVIRSDIPSKE